MNHIEIQTARNNFRNTHGKAKDQADQFRGSYDAAKCNGESDPDTSGLSELALIYFEYPSAYYAAEQAVDKALQEASTKAS